MCVCVSTPGCAPFGPGMRTGRGSPLDYLLGFAPPPPLGLSAHSVVGAVSRLRHRQGPLCTGTPLRCGCGHPPPLVHVSRQPRHGGLLNSGGSGRYVYIALGLSCCPGGGRSVWLGRGSPLPSLQAALICALWYGMPVGAERCPGAAMRGHGHARFWPCALWSGKLAAPGPLPDVPRLYLLVCVAPALAYMCLCPGATLGSVCVGVGSCLHSPRCSMYRGGGGGLQRLRVCLCAGTSARV